MLSVLDIFRVGIGPSSSHTVGPMRIAKRFVESLRRLEVFDQTARVEVGLRGSLAFTGVGHGTPRATILGLLGFEPETINTAQAEAALARVYDAHDLRMNGVKPIAFIPDQHLIFDYETDPGLHPNGVILKAFDEAGELLREQIYYSTGGGFIASRAQLETPADDDLITTPTTVPFPFGSAEELLVLCAEQGSSVADIIYANEDAMRPRADTDAALDRIVDVMMACIDRGLTASGILPGGLSVKRRASTLWARLQSGPPSNEREELFDWLNVYAMAVNEENAAGGQVVTAPTNGAAGIIPSILRYYCAPETMGAESRRRFLLTAGGAVRPSKWSARLKLAWSIISA